MLKFDEDIHCHGCGGRGEHPRLGYDCSVCGGSGLQEIQVGYGPRSHPHVIVKTLAAMPGRPYSAPVGTACGKTLSGLLNSSWDQPQAALRLITCLGCLRHLREILSK